MILDVGSEFDLADDRVWLNAAHQGPLPMVAADAVADMVEWKLRPHHLQPHHAFTDLPEHLRASIAGLVGAEASEVALSNSASYGLHVVANGLQLEAGDEVVVAANDFPSDILPWMHRRQRSPITIRTIEPAGAVPSADEVASAVTRRTRAVCLTWVHSFSGQVLDLDAIGQVTRDAGALFVVNGSQGVGAIPMSVRDHPIDVLISVGFKWLCGPYGTGFAWFGPRALEQIRPTKLYWLNALTTEDLEGTEVDLTDVSPDPPGCFDIFGTANFFNFAGLVAAVELIGRIGVERIHRHNLTLASQLVEELDSGSYEVQIRGHPGRLSSILFLRPTREPVETVAARLEAARIDVAVRAGMIRLSSHLYNTPADVGRTLAALRA